MRRDLLILFFILLSSALMADERTNEAPSFKVQGIVAGSIRVGKRNGGRGRDKC